MAFKGPFVKALPLKYTDLAFGLVADYPIRLENFAKIKSNIVFLFGTGLIPIHISCYAYLAQVGRQ